MELWIATWIVARSALAPVVDDVDLAELVRALARPVAADEAADAGVRPTSGAERPRRRDGDGPPRYPAAGRHPARAILDVVERLTGMPVDAVAAGLDEVSVRLDAPIAGAPADLDGARVLLAAHGLYLVEDPAAGRWLASRDRHLDPATPRQLTRVFELGSRSFRRAAEEIDRFVEERNRRRPELPPTRAVFVEGTGRIIVRAHSERVLAIVDEIVRGVEEESARREPRLLVHRAFHMRAEDLHARLREALDDDEVERLHVIVPRRTNSLVIRADEELARKVERILKVSDSPPEGGRPRRSAVFQSNTRPAGPARAPGRARPRADR